MSSDYHPLRTLQLGGGCLGEGWAGRNLETSWKESSRTMIKICCFLELGTFSGYAESISALRDYSWWCLGGHIWCHESKSGWQYEKLVTYQSSPYIISSHDDDNFETVEAAAERLLWDLPHRGTPGNQQCAESWISLDTEESKGCAKQHLPRSTWNSMDRALSLTWCGLTETLPSVIPHFQNHCGEH